MASTPNDGTPKTLETQLEINISNWDLKYRRIESKSATALSIDKKWGNIYTCAFRQDL